MIIHEHNGDLCFLRCDICGFSNGELWNCISSNPLEHICHDNDGNMVLRSRDKVIAVLGLRKIQ